MIKQINWLFLVAGTLIMIYVMAQTGKPLKTPATPLGILNLELAYNTVQTSRIVHVWTITDNIYIAVKNTWLDFIFIFFYTLFLFFVCRTLSGSFHGHIKKAGRFTAVCALNAGMFDIAENAGMLLSLNGFINQGISLFTAACAGLKWILAMLAIGYILLAGFLLLCRLLLKKKPTLH